MPSNAITAGGTAIPSAVTELTPKVNAIPASEPGGSASPQSPAVAAATSTYTSAAKNAQPAASNAQPANRQPDANAPPTKSLKRDEIAKAVDELNASYKSLRRTGLQFSVDDKAEELVVKVMDVDKDEVIRQIPPEDLLEFAAFLKEQAAQNKDHNPWSALTDRNQAPKIPSEGWLLDTEV